MKGDKVVKGCQEVTNTFLFSIRCTRNLDCFHAFNIDTPTISDSIHMRFQVFIDEIL